MKSERRRLILGALVMAVLGAFVAWQGAVTSDIAHFLPDGESSSDVSLARELAESGISRTLVVLVTAPEGISAEGVAALSVSMDAALRSEPGVAAELSFLDGGPPESFEETLWDLYQPRRFGFLGGSPEEVSELLSSEGLHAAAQRLKQQLASPMSSLTSRVAAQDPLLIMPDLFHRLQSSSGESLLVVDGRFITEDELSAVLFLGTQSASFDSNAMRPLLAGVTTAFDRVNRTSGGDLQLQLSGAARFAVRAEEAIRGDIRRVAVGSCVGLILLLLLLFRSIRLVLLTLPVLATGFLAGLSACLLVFGQVHGLTLAFGASLIGVSLDYTVHFHCHQILAPDPSGPRGTLTRLWTGLSLGAATTVVGFVALLIATFPGLRELALFAATGISAALMATALFLPGLAGSGAAVSPVTMQIVGRLDALLAWLANHRWFLRIPVAAAVGVCLVGLPQLAWNDNIADLNRLDPGLLAEDAAVRQKVLSYEQRRLVVALGPNDQAALEVNDQIAKALEEAQVAGEIAGFRSLSEILPSASRQREADSFLRNEPGLSSRFEAALGEEGFNVEAFEPFRAALDGPAVAPLLRDDLLGSPLESLVRPFWVSLKGGPGVLSFVHGMSDADRVANRLQAIDGAHMVDITGVLSDAYRAYRERMASLLLLGLGAVLVLVWLRHRRWAPTWVAFLPAVLAAATTASILALCGVELNMLSLVALLMVVSMGVDYGVFLAEAGDDDCALRATHLAIVVASLSTILGFGLLALSDYPALLSIGVPSGLGVLLCLILAPTVRLLIHRR
jgi:predicted exporter